MKVRSYITSLVALSTFSGLLLSWSIQQRYADIEAKHASGVNSLIGTQTNQTRQQIDQFLATCELVIRSNVLYLGANVGQQRESLKESLVGLSKHALSPVQQDSLQKIDRKIGLIHSLVQRKMAVPSARTSSSSVSNTLRKEFSQETTDLKAVFDTFNHEVSELIFRTEQDIAVLRADLPRTILLLG